MEMGKTGALISAVRKERGMTQKELAEQLHVSDRTISKWERGAGFPDTMLWEPLADALKIPVQCLISGERQEDAEALRSDHMVRDVIKAVCLQSGRKMRRNIGTGVASLALALLAGFVVFGILDYSGVFLKDMCFTVSAEIYEEGEPVGETTVQVDGTMQRIGERNFTGEIFRGLCAQDPAGRGKGVSPMGSPRTWIPVDFLLCGGTFQCGNRHQPILLYLAGYAGICAGTGGWEDRCHQWLPCGTAVLEA